MKRSLSAIAILASFSILASSLIPSVMARAFTDVSHQHANHKAIEYVKDNDVVGGYPDGTYLPGKLINRAEFTKIVIGAEYSQEEIDNCQKNVSWFHDVPQTEWYAPYVCMAKREGIIDGYPDQTFRPTQNITFVEAAKIISIGLNIPIHVDSTDPIWYRVYVEGLADRKAIPTTINRFDQAVTRGEMAEFIYRIKARILDKNTKTYEDLQ